MKRTDSLKRKKEFRYTYRVGKSQANRFCALVYAKNRTDKAKVGFSVSKKIGNSVRRNRAKRRLREAVTPLIPQLRGGYNLIIVAREPVVEAEFSRLCDGIRALLTRANLLKTEERT